MHFGHQTKRWNPKMKPFIFEKRNQIYIINLDETVQQLHRATEFLQEVTRRGGKILFVGCKKQAQEAVKEAAPAACPFYKDSIHGRRKPQHLHDFAELGRALRWRAVQANLSALASAGRLCQPRSDFIRLATARYSRRHRPQRRVLNSRALSRVLRQFCAAKAPSR